MPTIFNYSHMAFNDAYDICSFQFVFVDIYIYYFQKVHTNQNIVKFAIYNYKNIKNAGLLQN